MGAVAVGPLVVPEALMALIIVPARAAGDSATALSVANVDQVAPLYRLGAGKALKPGRLPVKVGPGWHDTPLHPRNTGQEWDVWIQIASVTPKLNKRVLFECVEQGMEQLRVRFSPVTRSATEESRMITQMVKSIAIRAAFVSACGLHVAGCAGNIELGPDAVKGKTPDGTVDMQEVQAAYIGSGSAGTGVLSFRGKEYKFQVGGVGIGGIGLSTVDAKGEVYNLRDLAQFPGTYGQARYGFAIGTASAGDLWMQNESGVILHLKAKRTGLILSLGGDAVVISMGQ